jgi:hypothetical protein
MNFVAVAENLDSCEFWFKGLNIFSNNVARSLSPAMAVIFPSSREFFVTFLPEQGKTLNDVIEVLHLTGADTLAEFIFPISVAADRPAVPDIQQLASFWIPFDKELKLNERIVLIMQPGLVEQTLHLFSFTTTPIRLCPPRCLHRCKRT